MKSTLPPPAPATVVALPSPADLVGYVWKTLCERDALDPDQAPLFRTPLKRGARVCGWVFHVEGPRLLRTSAVWAADEDRILFYDSTGARFQEASLSESPEPTAALPLPPAPVATPAAA